MSRFSDSALPPKACLQAFGWMLRGLKETYGWPGLTGLEPGALIQLLERSAKDRSEAELVDRVDPLIRAGWMDLLAAPRSERAALAAAVAGRIGVSASALTPLADACRRSLALGFGERRAATAPARQGQQGWIGFAIATILVAAAGFVLAVEAGRGRLEVVGLRERNQSRAGRNRKVGGGPRPGPQLPAAARIISRGSGPGQSAVPPAGSPPPIPGRWTVKAARRSAARSAGVAARHSQQGRICPALVTCGGPSSADLKHSRRCAAIAARRRRQPPTDGPKWPVSPILKVPNGLPAGSRLTPGTGSSFGSENVRCFDGCFNHPRHG